MLNADSKVRQLPKPGDLWNRPDTRIKGDTSADPIYNSVGIALTAWEGVECAFAFIFSRFMFGGPNLSSAERVYGSIMSPGGRRDALMASSETFFHWSKVSDEHKDDFKALIAHHHKASALRNDIAHGMVFCNPELGFYLLPAPYNSGKNKDFFIYASSTLDSAKPQMLDLHAYAYTAEDVNSISEKFVRLRNAAHKYGLSLTPYLSFPTPQRSRQSAPPD